MTRRPPTRRCVPPLALLLLAGAAHAQERSDPRQRPDPEAQMRAKLQAPFLRHVAWVRDLAEARGVARERGQLVFGYFTTAGP